MQIRYEDFVLNPLGKTVKIYDFIGIEMTVNIKEWLNTAMSATNKEDLSKTFPMGLKRNVMTVLNTWRTELTFDDVIKMQTHCNWVLRTLGYRIYHSEAELRYISKLHFKPNW